VTLDAEKPGSPGGGGLRLAPLGAVAAPEQSIPPQRRANLRACATQPS